ncbi:MAG TPA: DNA recombination protein RmuC [Patescibacteria group bacterium]|nr:DNA recombination protein RmuC [Patescibacteria group bacterium]
MPTAYLIGLLVILAGGFTAVILMLRKSQDKPQDSEALKVMMEWMKEIKQETVSSKQRTEDNLKDINKSINERLDNAGRVISQLTKELGGVSQIGPDIRKLTETLSSPKLRGNFGEDVLQTLLTNIFPKELCKFQYRFKNGEIVDAALIIGELLVPIDSKFSMENYRLYKEAKTDDTAADLKKSFFKDVKKRVDEIHRKYILPQEGTLDYAFMFVPSEGIYMEIADDQDAQTYARGKNVVIVGPNTLNVTLRALMVSLRGQQISKAAKQVLAAINGIKQESDKFGKSLDTMANHVKNTNNSMSGIVDAYVKLKNQIANAANLELESEKEPEKLTQADKLL